MRRFRCWLSCSACASFSSACVRHSADVNIGTPRNHRKGAFIANRWGASLCKIEHKSKLGHSAFCARTQQEQSPRIFPHIAGLSWCCYQPMGRPMPRYFFHMEDGATAREEAIRFCGEMLSPCDGLRPNNRQWDGPSVLSSLSAEPWSEV